MSILPSYPAAYLNQLAWRLAAGIAAAAALVAVILSTSGSSAPTKRTRIVSSTQSSSSKIEKLPLGGNIPRCIEFCASHVTPERSFVVFSNGTCVIVDEPTSQPVVDAIHTLEDCSGPNARFITREVENGHYLVTYRRAAFHCLFAEEISAQRNLIDKGFLRFLAPAEKRTMPESFNPPFHAKLGLVARARLNLDAGDLVVAKIIRAKPLPRATDPPREEESRDLHPTDPPATAAAPPLPAAASLPTLSIPDGHLLPPKNENVLAGKPEPPFRQKTPDQPSTTFSPTNVFESLSPVDPPLSIE